MRRNLSNALAAMAGFNAGTVKFTLAYSDEETGLQPACAGADVQKIFI